MTQAHAQMPEPSMTPPPTATDAIPWSPPAEPKAATTSQTARVVTSRDGSPSGRGDLGVTGRNTSSDGPSGSRTSPNTSGLSHSPAGSGNLEAEGAKRQPVSPSLGPSKTSATRGTGAISFSGVDQGGVTDPLDLTPPSTPPSVASEEVSSPIMQPLVEASPRQSSAAPETPRKPVESTRFPNSRSFVSPFPARFQSPEAGQSGSPRRDPYSHLTLIQRDIMLQIHNSTSPRGASLEAILRGIPRRGRAPADIE